jgi:hypothetical protein
VHRSPPGLFAVAPPPAVTLALAITASQYTAARRLTSGSRSHTSAALISTVWGGHRLRHP